MQKYKTFDQFFEALYVKRNQSIKAKTFLYTELERVEESALLDSGATECFINPSLVKKHSIKTMELAKPQTVRNVDGTINRTGRVSEAAELMVQYHEHVTLHCFLVADIGEDGLILGYPFFKAANPIIDWPNGVVDNIVIMEKDKWEAVPEQQEETWFHPCIAKVTMAQQLAEQAMDKRVCTWEEIVPICYHHHGKVFSEKASECFPNLRPWDHAIDLKSDAPTSIDCRVYPLAPREKEEQKKFLEGNLCLN